MTSTNRPLSIAVFAILWRRSCTILVQFSLPGQVDQELMNVSFIRLLFYRTFKNPDYIFFVDDASKTRLNKYVAVQRLIWKTLNYKSSVVVPEKLTVQGIHDYIKRAPTRHLQELEKQKKIDDAASLLDY